MKKTILFYIVLLISSRLFGAISTASETLNTNDICATATTLAIGYNCLEFDDTNGTMTGASDEGTGVPSCAGEFRSTDNYDKWYAFTMPVTGKALFQFQLGFIDEAVVYSGTCSALIEIVCLKEFRDPSIITLNPSETYYLRLNKASAPGQQFEEFCLQLTELPPNDICSEATALTVGVACDGTFLNGDNRSASLESTIIDCLDRPADFNVDTWYSFIAPFSGRVVVKTTLESLGAAPDFKVYEGTCSSLEEIYCGFGTGNLDSIALVTPGETYFIQTFSDRFTEPFCISVKEQVSFDNLFYGVTIDTGGIELSTIEYDQMEAPTPIELDEIGECGQIAFASVEPAGVIKIKSIAPFCGGGDALSSASGNWSMRNYRLLGLTDDVIPVTFTFEFTGSMSFTPKNNIGNTQTAASFNFSYGFFNSDIEIKDGASSDLSHISPFNAEFFFEDIEANEGTIDILPKIIVGGQTYNVNSIIADFITDYNALPAAERNSPTLTLSTNFLTAINQPIDVTLWDTLLQQTLETEATNFLAALTHLGFDSQLGYDANTVSVNDLSYKHLVIYNYERDLTVLIDNADFFNRPTIWFNGSVNAFNRANPNTIISDFSNTGRLTKIRVPREFMLNSQANTLQISSEIVIPIEETECTDGKLLLPELPLDSREFNSIDTITAKSIIEEGKEVVFRSEKIIVLASGFHAQSGSQFSAEIGPVPDCNTSTLTTEAEMQTILPVQTEKELIKEVVQLMAYPNPFTSTTTLDYYLPISAPVTIKVIDLFGQEKATLLQETMKEAGRHQVTYRPNNMAYGTYLVVLQSGADIKVQKLLLIKE